MRTVIQQLIQEAHDATGRLGGCIDQLTVAATLLIDCFEAGHAVLICGNGGSAADAQHIAAEMAGRYQRERAALNCLALTTNTSNLTAIGNDYGFDRVFSRQVEAHLRPGDVLWAISTSGKSPSVIEAVNTARAKGGRVLGFTGSAGGKLAELCDVCFRAPAEKTAVVQQLHQVAYHILCDLVEQKVGNPGKRK